MRRAFFNVFIFVQCSRFDGSFIVKFKGVRTKFQVALGLTFIFTKYIQESELNIHFKS